MPADNPEAYEKWAPNKFEKDFKTPTLVIAGTQDAIIPAPEVLAIAGNIPGARSVELDCGHLSNLELPRAVSDELAAFLVPATMSS